MATILNFLIAVAIFGLFVFVHEWGHYMAARLSGIAVVEFAIGMGPVLFSWRRGDTIYSFRLLPFGGFCKFVGEDEVERWTAVPRILSVTDTARSAGIEPGDIIVRVDGATIPFDAQGVDIIAAMVRERETGAVELGVVRGESELTMHVERKVSGGESNLGIRLSRIDEGFESRVLYADRSTGLCIGDKILKIGRAQIDSSPDGARRAMNRFRKLIGQSVMVFIERQGKRETISVCIDEKQVETLILGRADYALPGDPLVKPKSNIFGDQNVFKRIATIAAGPVMNFVLAFVVALLFFFNLEIVRQVPIIFEVIEDMGAQEAGMMAGDIIVEVNGQAISYDYDGVVKTIEVIGQTQDAPVDFVMDRVGERVAFSVMPVQMPEGYMVGFTMGKLGRLTFGEAVEQSASVVKYATTIIFDGLKTLFTTKEGFENTAGPVGIMAMMTEQVSYGWERIVDLLIVLSVNLGLLNLMPIPGMDGGRLLFLLIEAIFRKPVNPKYEMWIHAAGLVVLMGFILIITFRDITRLVSGG